MSILDQVKHTFRSDNDLVFEFPSEQIPLASQLIVSETQEALFVKGGAILDIFGPGTHTLVTGNVPILSRIINLPFGGRTPFSAEVWFVNKTVKRNLKWGTKTPIAILDSKFNYPISVRAFGQWGFRIKNVRSFFLQLIGTQIELTSRAIYDAFVAMVLQTFSASVATTMAAEQLSIFSINAHLPVTSAQVSAALSPELDKFGLELINFNIESINIPNDEIQKIQAVMGRRMEIDQFSSAKVGQGYVTARSFDVLASAAQNSAGQGGGLMGAALGLGIGLSAVRLWGASSEKRLTLRRNP
jgi:membrane protease subunit (stomatin/prohibitin family)